MVVGPNSGQRLARVVARRCRKMGFAIAQLSRRYGVGWACAYLVWLRLSCGLACRQLPAGPLPAEKAVKKSGDKGAILPVRLDHRLLLRLSIFLLSLFFSEPLR